MNARRAAALLVLTLASAGCANSDPANKTAEPANKAAETTTSERSATTSQRATETSRTTRSEAASPNDERAIRRLNWREVIDATPGITIDESSTYEYYRPNIAYADTGLYGRVETDSVVYVDLDGDSIEEAILPVWPGLASCGDGMLIYRLDLSSHRPELVGPRSFYDEFAQSRFAVTGSRLVITTIAYNDWQPGCGPGVVSREYQLRDGNLEQVGATTETGQPSARQYTIEHFYYLLADGQYEEAYNHLSPGFKAENPFPTWRQSYASTTSITYQVSEPESDDAPVAVVLDVVDSAKGEMVLSGRWTLTYSVAAHQWLLDSNDFPLGGEFPIDE
jgi:hypothetical protein